MYKQKVKQQRSAETQKQATENNIRTTALKRSDIINKEILITFTMPTWPLVSEVAQSIYLGLPNN